MVANSSQEDKGATTVRLRVRELNSFVFNFKPTVFAPRALSREAAHTFSARRRMWASHSPERDHPGRCPPLRSVCVHDSIRRGYGRCRVPLVETRTVPSEMFFESGHLHRIDIADGLDPDQGHAALRDLTHARNAAHWKWEQESLYLVRLNHELAIRFLPVGRNLCEKLVRCHAAEAVRFSSSRICCRMVFATSVAVGKLNLFSVTSR